MWYLVLVVASAAIYFASRRWGRTLYYRWGRLIPFRRAIVSKSRPPTPPLIETSIPLTGGSGTDGEGGFLLQTNSKEEYDDDRLHTVGKGGKCGIFPFVVFKGVVVFDILLHPLQSRQSSLRCRERGGCDKSVKFVLSVFLAILK